MTLLVIKDELTNANEQRLTRPRSQVGGDVEELMVPGRKRCHGRCASIASSHGRNQASLRRPISPFHLIGMLMRWIQETQCSPDP